MPVTDCRRRQRGASMIEVLVAILIVSLGVISMAGLLATATRLAKASEMRAIASLLAADIGDRMKANLCGVRGEYVNPQDAKAPRCKDQVQSYNLVDAFAVMAEAPEDADACADVKACTPGELAAIDLAEWRQALYHALPNGSGYVQYDAGAAGAGGGAADVWIAWLDPQALSSDEFADLDAANAKTCPPGFKDATPQPRCMYFRVGL